MSDTVIAAQLYTVREFCKTAGDFAKSMTKVSQIGYEAVQVSGLGPIDPPEIRRICDGEGLKICATHVSFDALLSDIAAQIDYHKTLGCENVAIGGLPAAYRENGAGFARFAKESTEVARKLAAAGLTFSYHNHSFEFEKFDGRLALDIIYEDSDPGLVMAELDTYWVQHGGGDPAAWIEKLSDRLILLHLKDMKMKGREQKFAEVGEGNLNWARILPAAEAANARWYLVEQDVCERDPFESLRISYANLREMGLE